MACDAPRGGSSQVTAVFRPRFDVHGHRGVTSSLSARQPDRTAREGRSTGPLATPCRIFEFRLVVVGCSRCSLRSAFREVGGCVRVSFENSTVCRAFLSGAWFFVPDCFVPALADPVRGWLGFVSQGFVGEFDPGSGRTLAACLTHASRAVRPFGVHERRTGE